MKILFNIKNFLLTAVLLLTIYSCSNKIVPSSEANYVSEKDGTITMRALGYGTNEQEAIGEAEKQAINVILFRGLPESKQKIALIGTNESEEMAKNKPYFEKFYNQKRFKTFIMSSIPVSGFEKQNGGSKRIAVDVKINLIALRNDLEQNNVIRKFGF